MNPPKTVKESELFSEKEKELFEYILLRWGSYYTKIEVSGQWSSVVKEILGDVVGRIKDGTSFSDSLALHPEVFPQLYQHTYPKD